MDKTAEILFNYLRNVLYHSGQEPLDMEAISPEFQKLGWGMQFLADCLREEREFVKALAKGDLSLEPPGAENVLAASAKELQSSLRHLQWQTKQVAKGDYSQRVEFMGEFSQAFNTMTAQLADRSRKLAEEQKLVQEKNLELEKNLGLMQALANYTHNMIFVFSREDGREIFANHPAEEFNLKNPEAVEVLKERLRCQQLEENAASVNWDMELEMDAGQDKIYYSIESFGIYQDNEPIMVHIVVNDTERKKQENFIYNLAYLDPLTGLSNRRYAMELMERWEKEGRPFLLSFVDVDYLKYCNDTFGHEKGDKYLMDIAGLLQTMYGEVCRIGGDEFILLAQGTDIRLQDERLKHLREVLLMQKKTPYPMSFSYATTVVPAYPTTSLNAYIKMTDEKMQQYKDKNKKPLSDVAYIDERILMRKREEE